MSRALFVRSGALGDFILTLPVLVALLEREERVDVACSRSLATLLPLVPDPRGALGRVWDVAGPDTLWMHGGRDPVGYARAYAFSPRVAEGLVGAGIPAVHHVPAHPPAGVGAAGHYAGVLAGAPVRPPLLLPRDLAWRPTVVIAPGSGGGEKRAPMGLWEEVADRLARGGVDVEWVAGPVEAAEEWATRALRPDLPATATLAASVVAWLGPDSGPSHLAAAARRGAGRDPADVLVRFQSTDPAVWAPEGATVVDPAASPLWMTAWALARATGTSPGPSRA